MTKYRVYPIKSDYDTMGKQFTVQVKKWWGWKTIFKSYTLTVAKDMCKMLKEQSND